jgi:tryptophanyl-tRNA synthetase
MRRAAPTVLSGIQPTGVPHLGNYLGALRNWVRLQDGWNPDAAPAPAGAAGAAGATGATGAAGAAGAGRGKLRTLYSVVDLHAITTPHTPARLRADALGVTATLIACGLDPASGSTTLFQQSHVRQHAELAWLLSCRTPLGWLNRMTQFKQKSADAAASAGIKHKKNKNDDPLTSRAAGVVSLGLYSYPVLMAADILLYRATHVPVGDDQLQHLELCRDIAGAFNRDFLEPMDALARGEGNGGDMNASAGIISDSGSSDAIMTSSPSSFPLPKALLMPGASTRVMSLRDGTRKMSKSDPSSKSRIDLTDGPDAIAKKVRKAKTDSVVGSFRSAVGPESVRPEVRNLVGMIAALRTAHGTSGGSGGGGSEWTELDVCDDLDARNATAKDLKMDLIDALVEHVCPIGKEIARLQGDPGYLSSVLDSGAETAGEIAEGTMKDVRQSMGL